MRFDKRGLIGKRGLSDVVTTGLIILLAIAAVVIVWSFVRPAITDVGEKISGECLTVDVEPVSCTGSGASVRVKNGPGDTTIDTVRVIFYTGTDGSGTSTVEPTGDVSACTNIAPLQTATCTVATPAGAAGGSVGVAPVIGGRVCSESTVYVDCS